MGALAVQRSRLILKCVRSFKSFKSYAAETLTLLVRSPLSSLPRDGGDVRGVLHFFWSRFCGAALFAVNVSIVYRGTPSRRISSSKVSSMN